LIDTITSNLFLPKHVLALIYYYSFREWKH